MSPYLATKQAQPEYRLVTQVIPFPLAGVRVVMSNVCAFCQVKESSSVGKWLVCPDCSGRRDPLTALCESCVENGYASTFGVWAPHTPLSFRCNVCIALNSAQHRNMVLDEFKSRCDPTSICRDIFAVCPWMAHLRQAPPNEIRVALRRVKRHLPPSNSSGLEDVLGQGGEIPSESTSLLLMTAQFSGTGSQAEKVALESVDRLRLSRAPHMKYKYLLSGGVSSMDKALEYFRRVVKESNDVLVRSVAMEREFICEAMRVLFTPYAPSVKGLAPPGIRPEGLVQTLAIFRTLSRMVKDAARVETPFLRVFDACYGYLLKYNIPVSKGSAVQVNPSKSSVKPEVWSDRGSTVSDERKPAPRRPSPRRNHPRSPRPSEKKFPNKQRRSRSPRHRAPSSITDASKDKDARSARLSAWGAGSDEKGSLKGKCKNCYVGMGLHVPIHKGKSCQELGNQCFLPCHARSCEKIGACHWARDCPNRRELNLRPRR